MMLRIGLWTTIGLLWMIGPAMAQQPPRYQPQPPRYQQPPRNQQPTGQYRPMRPVQPQVRPNQPVVPQVPTLQRSPGARQPATIRQPGVRQPGVQQPVVPRAGATPFHLTPQQQAELDRVLAAWEQRGKNVRTFACDFTQWKINPVFNKKTQADGKLKYEAPDKGMFHVESDPPDHWVCDGKSVFQFDSEKKQLIENQLPPELQGKAIANSPLPFLFGAEAAKLKQRYFMRIVTPPGVQGQVWIEAIPRHQQDAANFRMAELILTTKDMQPYALQIHETNGKDRTAYEFRKIVVNDPFGFLRGNPFKPFTPLGWKKVVEPAARPGARPAAHPAARPQVTLQPRVGAAR